jgi:hypothetical protein
MTSGRLTDLARTQLFKIAIRMVKQKKKKGKLYHKEAAGEVKTSFDTAVIGTLAGYLFEAEVDTPHGNAKVKYLVRQNDIEDLDEEDDFVDWKWVPTKRERNKSITPSDN